MKHFLPLIFFISVSIVAEAQYQDNRLAINLITSNSKQIGLSEEDLKNIIITNNFFNKSAGTQMIYVQQSHKGLPVLNEILVLAFKENKLVSLAGSRIKGIEKRTANVSSVPVVTPDRAVRKVLSEKKLNSNKNMVPVPVTGTSKLDYGKLDVAVENITAELLWVPLEDGKKLRLAWQIFITPINSSDYLLVRVDAHNNEIINETNLTVYCNFDHADKTKSSCNAHSSADKKTITEFYTPSLVGTVNYLVIPWPAESPNHAGGSPAIRTNPWLLAGGNASSLGWHNDGTTDYVTTRGNNVHAQEDRDDNNNTLGVSATSTTATDPLNFNFTPDFTVHPAQTSPITNQQFNITNLFYWNNIIHDLTYVYGFDEASGNFQNNNMGRGGAGNDYVIADAQDAGGTGNANFATPADGTKPRMQMYLWGGNPARDGDVDNGIVVHEYAHGISNRLTGGSATAGCLGNAEQMGEGWGDYYALMYTQDWANSNLNSGFNSPRGIATYASGQSPSGGGIRSQRYCTNFAVNNKVYAGNISSAQHDRGEIWCATLWDMTWNIINQVGTINPNLFNIAGGGGNTIALKLVTEGLKLQPCNPGFISGRDAILQADAILYGGQFNCAIREAFRRRGMGGNASQGSSASVSDQIADFNSGGLLKLTQGGMTTVQVGQDIVYKNSITSYCQPISGYTLRDTLPSNVTYVSGGTYDAATRVVSWVINQAASITQDYNFTVNVNAGSYFAPSNLINETVSSSSIPASWITNATPAANVWTVSNTFSLSAPNSFYAQNYIVAADQRLELANAVALPPATSPLLTFSHRFNTEDGWDGGVVEISTNGGSSWSDLGPYMSAGGYNGSLGVNPPNLLSGRSAFTGTITSFMATTINLSAFAGMNVKIRFRFGSDDNTSAPTSPAGWWVDNIRLNVAPVVNMKSVLFNNANAIVAVSDTITLIVDNTTCNNLSITNQPENVITCTGSTTTFNVGVTGSGISYQWQVSIAGGSFTDLLNNVMYSGVNTDLLSITGVTADMNDYNYRVILSGIPCGLLTSNAASLNIHEQPEVTLTTSNAGVTPGTTAILTAQVSPAGTYIYEWYRNNILTAGNTASITVDMDSAGLYKVIVTDANGCRSESNNSLISVSESNMVFIFPNPNTGLFQVRFFNPGTGIENRTISIFDSKGSKVYVQPYLSGPGYQRMDVNISHMPSGVYLIDLRNSKGKKLASGKVLVSH